MRKKPHPSLHARIRMINTPARGKVTLFHEIGLDRGEAVELDGGVA